MKLIVGWAVSAGLVLAATSAAAQMLTHDGATGLSYRTVSDLDGPYGGVPPAPPPYPQPSYGPPADYGYAPPADYGYAPPLMPPQDVYAVLRENGFQALGIPHRRGFVYEISTMDPAGADGRLFIDGRTGRIIRFMPAYWDGRSENFEPRRPYGAQAALLSPTAAQAVPRPPAAIPHVPSRSVPLPAPKPSAIAKLVVPAQERARDNSAEPATQQQASAAATPTVPAGREEPATAMIKPTKDMPPVQGLE